MHLRAITGGAALPVYKTFDPGMGRKRANISVGVVKFAWHNIAFDTYIESVRHELTATEAGYLDIHKLCHPREHATECHFRNGRLLRNG